MTYHTNHCWCSKSNYNGESFNGEVMVYFGEDLATDFIDDNLDEVKDFDFSRLTEKRKFFNESKYKEDLGSLLNQSKEKIILMN